MKFSVLAGQHHALVDLETDGKGGFSGTITSKEFGIGKVSGLQTGDHFTGSASIDGHSARFDATVSGHEIAGRLTAGWFFSQDFKGEAV